MESMLKRFSCSNFYNISLHQCLDPHTLIQLVSTYFQRSHLNMETYQHHNNLFFAIFNWPLLLNLRCQDKKCSIDNNHWCLSSMLNSILSMVRQFMDIVFEHAKQDSRENESIFWKVAGCLYKKQTKVYYLRWVQSQSPSTLSVSNWLTRLCRQLIVSTATPKVTLKDYPIHLISFLCISL